MASADARRFRPDSVRAALRVTGLFGLAFALFAVVLLAAGKDPIRAYGDILSSTLFSSYGFSEVVVKMIPLMLTALAVAIPARIWLINIGAHGAPLTSRRCRHGRSCLWLPPWGSSAADSGRRSPA